MVPHDNQGRSRQLTKETHSALLTKLAALTSMPRSVRRWLVFGFDGLLCLVTAWIALDLGRETWRAGVQKWCRPICCHKRHRCRPATQSGEIGDGRVKNPMGPLGRNRNGTS